MRNPWITSKMNDEHHTRHFDLDFVKQEMGMRFPFYDMRIHDSYVVFYCSIDQEKFISSFEELRKTLSLKGYIPIFRRERGEDLIYVTRLTAKKEKSLWVNIVLLLATILTTTITGSLLHIGVSDLYSLDNIWAVLYLENLLYGTVLFSFPLLSILFIHEMGHYVVSRKHGIRTSLPFFIPIPPIIPGFNIGTFGALISSHDPMPNKKALFDVGISGPLAGFIVAVPITIIGLVTSDIVPIDSVIVPGEMVLGISLLFQLLSMICISIPEGFTLLVNPVLFAGWIGMLITSINLLPAGQLDGGHIFRAALGEKQKYAGYIALFVLILSGLWFFAFIILFMIGISHPPPLNDEGSLDAKRKILFGVAVLILVLCYIPNPINFL